MLKKIVKKTAFITIVIMAIVLLFPQYYSVLGSSYSIETDLQEADFKQDTVGVFLINLDSSKNRLEFMKKFIPDLKYDYQKISAVNGNELSAEELENLVDFESYETFLGHKPKLGTIGCSLSHFRALKSFLKSNNEFALILEDDVAFHPESLMNAIDFSVQNKDLWDIVNLELFQRGAPKTIKELGNGQRLSVYTKDITNAGAYLINRKAAKNLLNKALPIKMPIDHYFTRGWELDIKFTGIEKPRLVHQVIASSDIGASKDLENKKQPIKRKIQKFIYRFQTGVMRMIHNYKMYFATRKI